ncbi:hypothetical protein WDW37_20450 [Bdellovibrionota bacterium FG-1]
MKPRCDFSVVLGLAALMVATLWVGCGKGMNVNQDLWIYTPVPTTTPSIGPAPSPSPTAASPSPSPTVTPVLLELKLGYGFFKEVSSVALDASVALAPSMSFPLGNGDFQGQDYVIGLPGNLVSQKFNAPASKSLQVTLAFVLPPPDVLVAYKKAHIEFVAQGGYSNVGNAPPDLASGGFLVGFFHPMTNNYGAMQEGSPDGKWVNRSLYTDLGVSPLSLSYQASGALAGDYLIVTFLTKSLAPANKVAIINFQNAVAYLDLL